MGAGCGKERGYIKNKDDNEGKTTKSTHEFFPNEGVYKFTVSGTKCYESFPWQHDWPDRGYVYGDSISKLPQGLHCARGRGFEARAARGVRARDPGRGQTIALLLLYDKAANCSRSSIADVHLQRPSGHGFVKTRKPAFSKSFHLYAGKLDHPNATMILDLGHIATVDKAN